MTLYHGSTVDIPHVDLAKSKPNKDFGRAFYLSVDEQQALELAQFRAEFEETTPVVNVYEFDEALFEKFKIKCFEDYTEEWAHFVRQLLPPFEDINQPNNERKGLVGDIINHPEARQYLLILNAGFVDILMPGEDILISKGFSIEEAKDTTDALSSIAMSTVTTSGHCESSGIMKANCA